MSPLQVIVPGAPREHHPMLVISTDRTGVPIVHGGHAVLPCVCGWRSTPWPFTTTPLPILLAELDDHVADERRKADAEARAAAWANVGGDLR